MLVTGIKGLLGNIDKRYDVQGKKMDSLYWLAMGDEKSNVL